jgi:hypothetical protein
MCCADFFSKSLRDCFAHCPPAFVVVAVTFAWENNSDCRLFCHCDAAKESDSNRERHTRHPTGSQYRFLVGLWRAKETAF